MTNLLQCLSFGFRRHFDFKSGFAGAMAAAATVVLLTTGAQAQMTEAQKAAIKSSCRSDYMSNCMSVRPGGIEALQCLQSHLAKLSSACQTAVNAAAPKPKPEPKSEPKPEPAAAAPTPPPAPTPAKEVAVPSAPPSPAAVAAPPHAKEKQKAKAAAKIPPPRKQAVVVPPAAAPEPLPAPTAQQLNAIKVTCRGDFRRNCGGLAPGGAEAIACLRQNRAKLSPDCKISLADIAGTGLPPAPISITPAPPGMPNAPVVMTAVIGRACLRDLVRRCRDTGVGDGQKIACLLAHREQLAPLCKVALKITEPVR